MNPVAVCSSSTSGGAERHLVLLYSALAQRGHVPRLIGSVPGWRETGLASTDPHLGPKWAGTRSIVSGSVLIGRERDRVMQLAERAGADVFHAQFKREQIGFSAHLSRLAPVVWTEHGRLPGGARGAVMRSRYASASRFATLIVCVSDEVALDVRQVVSPECRVEVIPNAIDTVRIKPPTQEEKAEARAALGLGDLTVPVLAWIGRMDDSKLPLLAAEAAARFPGTSLLVGGGRLAERVAAIADGNGVRYLGFLRDPALVYRAADVFLFTSSGRSEGYPTNSLLEASAMGLPTVANAASGASRILDAAGGIICDDDAAALAEAAVRAVDPVRSAAARRWAERHDLESWASAYEALLTGVGR